MILRDPTVPPGPAPAEEPVARAVAFFAARTWPGERLTDGERNALDAHAREAAGLGEPDEAGRRRPGPRTPPADAQRMDAALEVARRTRRPAARRLARRGALRPCATAVRPDGCAWTLDLAPLAADCDLELGAYPRLREALEGIADLWKPGERPVLVLRGAAAWPGPASDPERPSAVRRFCEDVLRRAGDGRGWRGAPEVLRSGPS
jgi:hypothetical protein